MHLRPTYSKFILLNWHLRATLQTNLLRWEYKWIIFIFMTITLTLFLLACPYGIVKQKCQDRCFTIYQWISKIWTVKYDPTSNGIISILFTLSSGYIQIKILSTVEDGIFYVEQTRKGDSIAASQIKSSTTDQKIQ